MASYQAISDLETSTLFVSTHDPGSTNITTNKPLTELPTQTHNRSVDSVHAAVSGQRVWGESVCQATHNDSKETAHLALRRGRIPGKAP